uniref:Uncharacterized protein n=1 Tax=Oryza sativa subsp. japonica TaxID=39947 RepID=Q84UL2_ORYSJ|nr:hypothetical protein [Oryza sativa Japonica Group]BAD33527.1 hypothetical protein [Oryza sativa Japonica Group]
MVEFTTDERHQNPPRIMRDRVGNYGGIGEDGAFKISRNALKHDLTLGRFSGRYNHHQNQRNQTMLGWIPHSTQFSITEGDNFEAEKYTFQEVRPCKEEHSHGQRRRIDEAAHLPAAPEKIPTEPKQHPTEKHSRRKRRRRGRGLATHYNCCSVVAAAATTIGCGEAGVWDERGRSAHTAASCVVEFHEVGPWTNFPRVMRGNGPVTPPYQAYPNELLSNSGIYGKSTPKVPQLVIEIQNHPQTTKPDIPRPLTNQNRSQKAKRREASRRGGREEGSSAATVAGGATEAGARRRKLQLGNTAMREKGSTAAASIHSDSFPSPPFPFPPNPTPLLPLLRRRGGGDDTGGRRRRRSLGSPKVVNLAMVLVLSAADLRAISVSARIYSPGSGLPLQGREIAGLEPRLEANRVAGRIKVWCLGLEEHNCVEDKAHDAKKSSAGLFSPRRNGHRTFPLQVESNICGEEYEVTVGHTLRLINIW